MNRKPSGEYVLAVILCTLGVAKLVGPHDKSYLLSAGAYYSTAIAEVVLACWIAVVPGWLGVAGAGVFFLTGLAWAIAAPEGNCGCLGSLDWSMTKRSHIAMCCLGAAFVIALVQRRRTLSAPPIADGPL